MASSGNEKGVPWAAWLPRRLETVDENYIPHSLLDKLQKEPTTAPVKVTLEILDHLYQRQCEVGDAEPIFRFSHYVKNGSLVSAEERKLATVIPVYPGCGDPSKEVEPGADEGEKEPQKGKKKSPAKKSSQKKTSKAKGKGKKKAARNIVLSDPELSDESEPEDVPINKPGNDVPSTSAHSGTMIECSAEPDKVLELPDEELNVSSGGESEDEDEFGGSSYAFMDLGDPEYDWDDMLIPQNDYVNDDSALTTSTSTPVLDLLEHEDNISSGGVLNNTTHNDEAADPSQTIMIEEDIVREPLQLPETSNGTFEHRNMQPTEDTQQTPHFQVPVEPPLADIIMEHVALPLAPSNSTSAGRTASHPSEDIVSVSTNASIAFPEVESFSYLGRHQDLLDRLKKFGTGANAKENQMPKKVLDKNSPSLLQTIDGLLGVITALPLQAAKQGQLDQCTSAPPLTPARITVERSATPDPSLPSSLPLKLKRKADSLSPRKEKGPTSDQEDGTPVDPTALEDSEQQVKKRKLPERKRQEAWREIPLDDLVPKAKPKSKARTRKRK